MSYYFIITEDEKLESNILDILSKDDPDVELTRIATSKGNNSTYTVFKDCQKIETVYVDVSLDLTEYKQIIESCRNINIRITEVCSTADMSLLDPTVDNLKRSLDNFKIINYGVILEPGKVRVTMLTPNLTASEIDTLEYNASTNELVLITEEH